VFFSKIGNLYLYLPSIGLFFSRLEINPRTKELFEIVHYADTVRYSVDGFLNKNKNTLNADVGMLLSISGLLILNQMAEEGTRETRVCFFFCYSGFFSFSSKEFLFSFFLSFFI
jgi:hypothetical protein